jgi:hypothetical protein
MMLVYMPYPDINVNVKVLDELTLSRQCNAVTAILELLHSDRTGWEWNPAVKMWKGHEQWLAYYGFRLFSEFRSMGYPDQWTMRVRALGYLKTPTVPANPWWWGHEGFHDYNKAQLFMQDPSWYGRFFKNIDLNQMGWWPNGDKFIRGPKTPAGRFMVAGHPVFDGVRSMEDKEFIEHANLFHYLTPDMKGGIRQNEQPTLLNLLRTLHDRFHVQMVYTSHDHR